NRGMCMWLAPFVTKIGRTMRRLREAESSLALHLPAGRSGALGGQRLDVAAVSGIRVEALRDPEPVLAALALLRRRTVRIGIEPAAAVEADRRAVALVHADVEVEVLRGVLRDAEDVVVVFARLEPLVDRLVRVLERRLFVEADEV